MIPGNNLPNGFKETEIGPIPVDWEVVRLGETVVLSQKPRGLQLSGYDFIPFIPMELVPDDGTFISDYVPKQPARIRSGTYCEKGDILLAKITPSFENGKQGIVGEMPLDFAYATTEVYPLKTHPDKLDRMFLFHFLKLPAVRADIAGKMEGSTGRQRIPKAVIENYPIPLPPLPEQRRIAHVLSTIQQAIAAQDDLIAAAREVKRSLMQRLFTYGPGAEPAPTKETEIGLIPAGWAIEDFEDCILKKRVKVGKVKQKDYQQHGRFAVVDQGQSLVVGYSDDESKVYQGDLPVVIFGDHTRIFKFVDFPFVCGADGVKVLIPNRAKVDPRFFFHSLLTLEIPSRGYNRHYRLLREKKLPLPPLDEQREIARMLSAVDRKIEAEEQRKAALQELFKTMLHQLMTGQIRVYA